MKSIYKYPLKTTGFQEIEMPKNSEILCVQVQNETPCLYASVYTDEYRKEKKVIGVFGTGEGFSATANTKYIGTYQLHGGIFIGHVFEIVY